MNAFDVIGYAALYITLKMVRPNREARSKFTFFLTHIMAYRFQLRNLNEGKQPREALNFLEELSCAISNVG